MNCALERVVCFFGPGFNSLLSHFRTSYDAATRQHWLAVYRQKYNAKFLLKQGRCKVPGRAKMEDDAHKIMSEASQRVEQQVKEAVDQMIRVLPPRIQTRKNAAMES